MGGSLTKAMAMPRDFPAMPNVQELTRVLVYQALVDPER